MAQGLAYAHVRGLVHRDIKPANLLFDEEGRVRVADFGVARALAEAAWTEPAGAMVGTARYISPEAAEGKPVDGRADVYSLALVLYEAVTGTVPFVTDTTMGTLAARIGQPLPHNADLGPLDDVLARAAAPEVSSRLDAAGLAARLGALAAALPTPAPLPLVVPDIVAAAPIKGFRAPGVTELTDQPQSSTVVAPAAGGGAHRHQGGPGRDLRRRAERQRLVGRRSTRRATGGPTAGRKRNRKRTWWIVAAVAAVVLIAGGLAAAFESQLFTASHPVPTLVNLPLAKAQAEVAKLHMTLKEGAPVKSITIGAGSVVDQSPKPGTSLKEGSTITVSLSDGPPNVAVPNLANMTCAQAAAALQTVHLNANCTPGAYNDNVAATTIISWSIGNTPEPDRGALRQHHHHRAVARPSAGHGAEHPHHLHLRPGPGGAPGGRAHGHAGQRHLDHGCGGRRHLDHAGQRRIGALRLGRHRDRVHRAADDAGAQRDRRHGAAGGRRARRRRA